MSVDRDELRRRAEAVNEARGDIKRFAAADARYLAAVSPDVVLALLDHITELETAPARAQVRAAIHDANPYGKWDQIDIVTDAVMALLTGAAGVPAGGAEDTDG